jgi:hypothetical protein
VNTLERFGKVIAEEGTPMTKKFSVGDHVRWNSEAGHVHGTITKIHAKDVEYKGHTRRCSLDDPQYEITSDTTDHVAMHKGEALTKI